MLGTFPEVFSQGRLPKHQFPKWQLPKCAISQEATSQRLCKALSGATGAEHSRLGQTWEVATWEIAHLRSCHLRKYPWEIDAWENAFWKAYNIIIFTPIWIGFNIIIYFFSLITC